ncbi:hypothetical protein DSO57_1014798 [Entomophthora muscae]|uniref:Uncharacterized protein n=2 Tax=Entomophthora muscae TaxID=34485 RepID=A0ACC2UQZ6_9FUNG|nr:hypothetical protein DSO57_1022735 [Entomophthora muscae]KAJ9089253.1 hypothetical protein DSO57_1014798 [Entomophthora muscae]
MRVIEVYGLIAGVSGTVDHIFGFGDSYTDYGNLFEATQYAIPDPRYYYEGRTTNGPTWIEVAPSLFETPPNITSFAVGGASSDRYEFPGNLHIRWI